MEAPTAEPQLATLDERSLTPSPPLSDPAYFRPGGAPSTASQKALADNWVLRFNNLKRLYKLIIRYFECVLA